MSATLAAMEKVEACRLQKTPVWDGGLGQNPIPPPQWARDMAGRLIATNVKYTGCKGSPGLREALSSDLLVTGNGLKPLLFNLQLAFHRYTGGQGSVVHLVPHWPTYAEQCDLIGASRVSVRPANMVSVTPEELDMALFTHCVNLPKSQSTDCTRARLSADLKAGTGPICDPSLWLMTRPALVFLNSPNNPSGTVYSSVELLQIRRVCRKYGAYLLSDCIYTELDHIGTDYGPVPALESGLEPGSASGPESGSVPVPVPSPDSRLGLSPVYSRLDHTNYEKCITATSISKIIGAGGWRFGVLAFAPDLADFHAFVARQASSLYTCPTAGFEPLAAYVLSRPADLASHMSFQRRTFTAVHAEIQKVLSKSSIKVSRGSGAWYVLLDFTDCGLPMTTSKELCDALFSKAQVVLIPGSEFGFRPTDLTARLSYIDITVSETETGEYGNLAVDMSRTIELCTRICDFAS